VVSVLSFMGYFKTLYIANLYSIVWEDKWILNYKGFGKKQSYPKRDIIPAISLTDQQKP
jgi:hypothetical protein